MLTVLAAAAIHAAPTIAQTSQKIAIPAGTLDTALLTLAAQSHQQLLYTPELVAGRRAPAVSGDLTVEQALTRLAPELVVRRVSAKTIALRAAGTPVAAGASATAVAMHRPGAASPFVGDAPVAGAAPDAAVAGPHPAAPPLASTVSEVEVTGTHIRGVQNASPILVFTQADLLRSGQSTLQGALQQLPQNFNAGASEGNNTTGGDKIGRNPNFGSSINLRGLGNNATLILVNGRRMSGSGAFGDFNDISSIPTSAVERVEVLLDGASAIYGTDAVGGVVNIILRRDFQGAETRFETGAATEGKPAEIQAAQTFGKKWDGGDALISYQYQRRGSLPGGDRDFAANADLRPLGGSDQRVTTSFPGNILVPAAAGGTTPGFAIPTGQNGVGLLPSQFQGGVVNKQNQRFGIDILPSQTLNALYAAVNQDVGDRLELSADARFTQRDFRVHTINSTANLSVTRANPFFVSPNGGASDTIAYSFAGDLPNPVAFGSVQTLSLSGGGALRLFGDWRAEGYLTYGRDKESDETDGIVNTTFLAEALGNLPDNPATSYSAARDGFFNPFTGVPGANAAAVDQFISSGKSWSYIRGEVTTADLQADGTVWTLPGGPLKLAFGAQMRRETIATFGTNLTSTVTPVAQIPSGSARDVTAAFAEVRAPLFGPDNARPGLQRLELSVAGRVERYEHLGSTANPQFGILWQPTEGLRFRTTLGTSFRAPALSEVNGTAIFSPLSLSTGTSRINTLFLIGGNPDLKPETATSWTAGVDYRPPTIPGLSLSATWYDIKFRNRIDKPVQQNIAGALSDPNLASFITRISPGSNATDLARITALLGNPAALASAVALGPQAYGAIVDDRFVNTTTLIVRGVDLTSGYGFDLGGDRVQLGGVATYTLDYDQQVTPTSLNINKVGVASFPVRLRGRLTADWTRGRVTAGVAFNYISGYRDSLGVHIADQPSADLQLRLAPAATGLMRGLAVTFNVRNVFDRAPPFYNNIVGVAYDPNNADPVGRFVSVQLVRAW